VGWGCGGSPGAGSPIASRTPPRGGAAMSTYRWGVRIGPGEGTKVRQGPGMARQGHGLGYGCFPQILPKAGCAQEQPA